MVAAPLGADARAEHPVSRKPRAFRRRGRIPMHSATSRPRARCPAWSTATSRCGTRWPSPNTWASAMPACGRPKPPRAPGRAAPVPRCIPASSRLRNACTMNCGIRVTLKSIDAPLKRDLARLEELWADGIAQFGGPFLTGARFLRGRCVLRARRVPHPDLRSAAQRGRAALCRAAAGAAGDAGLVRSGAAGNLARRGARSRGSRRGLVESGPASELMRAQPAGFRCAQSITTCISVPAC